MTMLRGNSLESYISVAAVSAHNIACTTQLLLVAHMHPPLTDHTSLTQSLPCCCCRHAATYAAREQTVVIAGWFCCEEEGKVTHLTAATACPSPGRINWGHRSSMQPNCPAPVVCSLAEGSCCSSRPANLRQCTQCSCWVRICAAWCRTFWKDSVSVSEPGDKAGLSECRALLFCGCCRQR